MATFFNQASLSFNGYVTNSNVTQGEFLEVLSATKTAISSSYGAEDGIVYALSIFNSGSGTLNEITVSDDLGAYTVSGVTVTPLDYTDGSLRLYINGILQPPPTVTAGPPLTVSGFSIPQGETALILYEARTNAFAPLAADSEITNTATVSSQSPCAEGPITASATVAVENFTNLSIAKNISPDTVVGCDELTYTFVIQNSGNRDAVATDDLIVRDTFSPALSNIAVTFNGTAWTEGVNYTYDETTGEFATLPGQITVPAAIFTQDQASGVITTTPGTSVLTVSGTV